LPSLDIGCGQALRGTVNVDVYRSGKRSGTDFVMASAMNLPFVDGVFEQVFCNHVLEHLVDPPKALQEIVRVSKHEVELTVPHGSHPYAHIDTDHKWFFVRSWFSHSLSKLGVDCTVKLRWDRARPIHYLPIEILVRAYKQTND
jgi:ubiquinone/menaquinone biosynthesis C-methylase UbiE